jgi:hypothetical protein
MSLTFSFISIHKIDDLGYLWTGFKVHCQARAESGISYLLFFFIMERMLKSSFATPAA